ncbi:MAG: hypothetical protein LEGION0403_FIIPPAGN_01334 [Legionella sp.]|uniref:hypothetical protein n=1 Tax=Legionella sp. TaxID=459 RepID=UPI003D0DC3EA
MENHLDIFKNITEIFAYYDRPVLFISEINQAKYICELVDDTQEYEKWLVSGITESTYESLKALDIDLYTCFKHSKSGKSEILEISTSGIKSTEIISANLADDILPLKDTYLREKKKRGPFSCNAPHS